MRRLELRSRRTLITVAAAVVALAAALAVALLPGRESPTIKPPGGIGVASALLPRSSVFGQPVHARLDVLLDRGVVRPSSVQIRGAFTPYLVQGKEQRIREDVGPLTRLRIDYTLTCGDVQCLPPDPTQAGQGTVRLPPLIVTYRSDSGKLGTRVVTWPALIVSSRLALGDIAQLQTVNVPPFAASTTLPKPAYAIDPTLLRWLLAAAAALMLIGAAWLARRALAPPIEPVVVEPEIVDPYAGLTPLERALAAVRRTLEGADVPQRRRALEQLALALAAYNGGALAATATALAWSEPPPTAATTRGLVAEVDEILELERKRAAPAA